MKLLVAGGRDKYLNEMGYDYLDEIWFKDSFDELFSGMATGIDRCGVEWAMHRNIPVRRFYANWSDVDAPGAIIKIAKNGRQYNAKAGPDRNRKMCTDLALECPGSIVVVFPGGSGTDNLYECAVECNLKVHDLRKQYRYIK